MKIAKISIALIALTLSIGVEAQTSQKTIPNPDVMYQEQQLLQLQRSNQQSRMAVETKIATIDEAAKKAREEAQKEIPKPQQPAITKPVLQQPQTPPANNEAVPTCDCQTDSSPYNYPSNFLYGQNHQRLYRLEPHCKCAPAPAPSIVMPSAPPVTTPTTEAPSAQQSKSNTEKSSSYWNIQY